MNRQSPPTNHDPGPWKEISSENGIRVVEVPDFEAFSRFVTVGFGDSDCDWVWRGQRRSDWQITSTLRRSGKPEMAHLHNFRDAVARCTDTDYDISDSNPNAKDARLRLWALGQHHGLFTPLIDWTVYPFAALFFAFVEPDKEPPEFRAVFALCWHEVQSVNFHIAETDGMKPFRQKLDNPPYSDDFQKYLFDNFGFGGEEGAKMLKTSSIPSQIRERVCKRQYEILKERQLHIYKSRAKENHRIHNQGGLHIYTPDDCSVESWIHQNLTRIRFPMFVKILVPDSARTNVLRCLNKMNINYLSLFPDHEGAARHCNLALVEARLALGLREY